MLQELKIENYAIIDTLAIDFSTGLNTITGETGAGKSILLGALGLLAGGKAESAAFADNEKNCIIEALFKVQGQTEFFQQNDIHCTDGEIIIRRTISPTGRSRAFINDEPVSLSLLKELSGRLVDIHSQHQTLLLSQTDYQTGIVDSVSGYPLDNYRGLYRSLRVVQKELKTLTEQSAQNRKRADYLEFQTEQIAQAQINPGEIAEMEQRAKMLSNATEIAQGLAYAAAAMQHDEMGVVVVLKNALQSINKIKNNLPEAAEFSERLQSLYLESKDLALELEIVTDKIEINPAELQALEERLDTIYTLLHKHSVETPAELLDLYDQMQNELGEFVDMDAKIEQLQSEIDRLTSETSTEAVKISKARHAAAPVIEKAIVSSLKDLGIKDAQFSVLITDSVEFTPTGANKISMLFSGNAGKAPQPIENVASGGEMSRVMLAIKGLISRNTELSTIIFDEIDTGVSGVVAHKMGEIIEKMSSSMQVLNITHLPQVASKGDSHFLVYKDHKGTHIKRLSSEERVEHIAMMLSGSAITEAAIKQARELIGVKN